MSSFFDICSGETLGLFRLNFDFTDIKIVECSI